VASKKTPPKTDEPMVPISFRASKASVESANALAERLGLGVTRAFVQRAALNYGLAAFSSKKSDRTLAEIVKDAAK
jgi:hypothetical protein